MNLAKKFKRAFVGLRDVFLSELSIKIELGVGVLILLLGWRLGLARFEMLWLILLAAAIIVLEGLNTVLEGIIDLAEPRYRDNVRLLKDSLAALVLITIFIACLVTLIIFWPHLEPLLRQPTT